MVIIIKNNQYYIYQNIERNIDRFSGEPTLVVGEDNPLYGYYEFIRAKNYLDEKTKIILAF